ncbi:alpha-2-macroglobulin [Pseudoduganella sp. RAF19]|uniref:alpha-2-macroglobulin family protein n=1 Tax=Pseudoduganella sp. RAF19 TaxID=3233052 RepID=UPI003F98C4C1
MLALDAVPDERTIEANAWCMAQGINEKIPVRLLKGKERDEILAARKSFIDRQLHIYFAARGVVWKASARVKNPAQEKLPLAVLQCRQTLPMDSAVSLVWGAGIATETGIANTQDQELRMRTRPDFKADFSCERLKRDGNCIPILPMNLYFTAPVSMADAKAITLTGPRGMSWQPVVPKEEEKASHVSYLTFKGPFPEKSTFKLQLPAGMKDDAGRVLSNASRFPLTVKTDEEPPLVKFPARFGIIEARGDRMLPVTVRNIEAAIAARLAKPGAVAPASGPVAGAAAAAGGSAAPTAATAPAAPVTGSVLRVAAGQDIDVIKWMKRLGGGSDGWQPSDQYSYDMATQLLKKEGTPITLPKPNGRAAFEVIGIPLRQPGFYVVELASPKLGKGITPKGGTAYVSAAALVTNLAAHFKHGAHSSIVWVTTLDKARPVAKAQVALRSCDGKLLWQGTTDSNGIARINDELPDVACGYNHHYFVSARSGGDFTFTLSDWDRGIESWRFNLPVDGPTADNVIASTVFDRTLLRAGETVHMKHILRRHVQQGFALVKGPDKVFLLHEGSDTKYELPLSWNANGSAANDWPIPQDAKQGWYAVLLDGREAGRFRVEQFRVPTMKATLQGPKEPAVQPKQITLDAQLMYLSGGAAGGAPVKLRTMVEPKPVQFSDYDGFSFAAGDVKEGVERAAPAFDEDEGDFEEGEGGETAGAVATRSLTMDKAGGARITIEQLPAITTPRDLLAEMSWQDANGETLSSSTRIPLWPSGVVVGIQPDGWVASKDKLKFTVAVLDVQGKPVANAPVTVDYFRRQTYSHRRRLIGGFYAYENSSEIKALGQACRGNTDAKGLLICEGKAPESGNLILRAASQDGEGRRAVTQRETWVAEGEDWWFGATDSDRIDLLPEQKRYEPGQDASFQVRMPFREATALITVEREGVIDTYVRQLSGKEPAFTIPVKANYAPNVYVSALVVRGRVAGVAPTALVDLGKPAYKLGIAPLRVGWSANELKVQIAADKQVYKVRDKAAVKVSVRRADGSIPPAGTEIALAAVDVGLLELMPNTSWDLLEAMMQQRRLQVQTATAQMQVVGKRHFGRKAVAHGGGGGKGAGRELFDTLLFWNARIVLDANGEATAQVPLNDSLTAFRIVAIATGGAELFGTGRTDIRSTQDVMLLSGLPPMVREGDRFRAGFTLRNTTEAPLKVELVASVSGKALPVQSVTVAPGEAREIGWDYAVPAGVTELAWDVSVRAGDNSSGADRLRVKQAVKAAVPVRTLQATLLQLDGPQSMKVAAPADAMPGRGGVQTLFTARLADELPGVREYMQLYPYTCIEQQASRAVALRDAKMWDATAGKLASYLDEDGLLKYFPMMERGSDALTAYVLSVADEAGYVVPEMQKARMLDALEGFVYGRIVRGSPLATADLAVRKLSALEALSRVKRVKPNMLESFTIAPNLWPTSAVIDWYLILQRTPSLPEHAARMKEADQILRTRLNLQGTIMTFSTERRDDWWWLMVSTDANANRLMLAVLDQPSWQADMGRLARGALSRHKKGHWSTTVANAWGVLALEKFSKKFESEPVAGSSTAALAGASKSVTLTTDTKNASVLLPWPRGTEELQLKHTGTGKPWATVQSRAAIPLKEPLSSGYTIRKTITPVDQSSKGSWSRGDVYRVRLELEAQSDMTWVAVDDPIPASASVLGTGLGSDSKILTTGEKQQGGWVWPAFQERTFEAFRSYFEYVPKGKWTVEYTVRLNNPGQFVLPPTRVEAMYSPEMFGELPNAPVTVK